MRTWKAVAVLAAVVAACDDPVGLAPHDDAGISAVDTGPGEPPDAASLEDVGVPDTGEPPDAGDPLGEDAATGDLDSGEPADAGEPEDAGEPADAAEPADAGEPEDAATEPPDAQADWDGGGEPDVGMPPDASEPADGGGGTGAIGQPCTDATDCATDTCLGPDDGWPAEGYCAQSGCNTGNPISTCPEGSRCRDIAQSGYWPVCLDLCATDESDPCAPGFECTPHGGGSNRYYVCEPP